MTIPVTDPFGVVADPKMPFLAAALCPVVAQHSLEQGCPGLAAAGRVRVLAVRVTRYKPGRRCLIEYAVAAGPLPPITLVGKARAKGADREGFELLKALRGRGFGDDSPDGVSVPEPVGVAPELGMWLQRKVAGEPATRLLAGPSGVALAGQVAGAVCKLHAAGPPARRAHTVGDELRILGERLTGLARERPGWARRLGRLFDACQAVADTIPAAASRGIHRDFYPDQVLVAGPRLYLLDFDLYCEGDPALDAGNFLGHLTELALRTLGDPDALADREQAIEDRFAGPSRPAVRAYALLTLARHVALSTQFPDRRRLTGRLLELCEERLFIPRAPARGRSGGRS